jgi:hypothetical protein
MAILVTLKSPITAIGREVLRRARRRAGLPVTAPDRAEAAARPDRPIGLTTAPAVRTALGLPQGLRFVVIDDEPMGVLQPCTVPTLPWEGMTPSTVAQAWLHLLG